MRPFAVIMFAAAMAVGEENTDDTVSGRAIHPATTTVTVSTPSYEAAMGPNVYFDEGHHEIFITHGLPGIRQKIENPIRRDGYETSTFSSSFSRENLKSCDILVLIVPQPEKNRGFRAFPHQSAFNRQEMDELVLWIHEGGSLLLIAEHEFKAAYVADLAYMLGAQMFDGWAYSCQTETELNDDESGQIVFGAVATDKWQEYARRKNTPFKRYEPILSNPGILGRHPIVQGRNRKEEVKTILTWGGSAFRTSKEWTPIMTLGPSAVGVVKLNRNFERGDLPNHQFPLNGWLQAAARDFGKGRVVLQADFQANQFNDQYTLNVMHWLSGLLDGENTATTPGSESLGQSAK